MFNLLKIIKIMYRTISNPVFECETKTELLTVIDYCEGLELPYEVYDLQIQIYACRSIEFWQHIFEMVDMHPEYLAQ